MFLVSRIHKGEVRSGFKQWRRKVTRTLGVDLVRCDVKCEQKCDQKAAVVVPTVSM